MSVTAELTVDKAIVYIKLANGSECFGARYRELAHKIITGFNDLTPAQEQYIEMLVNAAGHRLVADDEYNAKMLIESGVKAVGHIKTSRMEA